MRDHPDVLDAPRPLDILRTSLRPGVAFEDLLMLRDQSYINAGIPIPEVSRENFDLFLEGVWGYRQLIGDADDVYTLYSDRGASDPIEDTIGYTDAMVQILTRRAPGPAQTAVIQGVGLLTKDNAHLWHPYDLEFVHYGRVNPPDGMRNEDIGYKIYLNPASNARTWLMSGVVRDVVDDPVRFPGVHSAKVTGPVHRRNDGIVIFLRDEDAVRRVLSWVREVQESHSARFLWDVPPGVDQVMAGVGYAAEPPRAATSFGGLRTALIFAALERHRNGTFQDFQGEVLNLFYANGIDPERVHLHLPGHPGPQPPAHLPPTEPR